MPNTPLVRLAVLFASLPLAVLAAWATGSKWLALAVFAAGVVLSIAMRFVAPSDPSSATADIGPPV